MTGGLTVGVLLEAGLSADEVTAVVLAARERIVGELAVGQYDIDYAMEEATEAAVSYVVTRYLNGEASSLLDSGAESLVARIRDRVLLSATEDFDYDVDDDDPIMPPWDALEDIQRQQQEDDEFFGQG